MRDCEPKDPWKSSSDGTPSQSASALLGISPSLGSRCALRVGCAVAVAAVFSALLSIGMAQDQIGELPGLEFDTAEPGLPFTEVGGGEFFSQELGTLLRIRYNTQSYGQEGHGNLDIGTMRVANFEDAIAFFDGQVTLNDVQGVGFNLGVGFRWLNWVPLPIEPERITGLSVWADGTSTESGNFFPQIGVSYESLGDMWDFRANSYIPLGKESQLGAFEPTGEIDFQGHFLSQITVADRHTSFNVGELEFARRLGVERDAWAFAGPYVLANDEDDSAGYRVGLRGYAYPDLLLQFAVTDDDIFKTNATFSLVWFVGRTRTDFQPTCGLPDRMREPVMRNDYVTLAKSTVNGGIPLTDAEGTPFRFVHVSSSAGPGGDGTYENPFDEIQDPNGSGSQEGDIILLWANSVFENNSTLELKDNQRLLGEGNGEVFTINTLQEGVFEIPETSPGARDGNRPLILDVLGMGAVQLADGNEVANFDIDGGAMGLFAPAGGAGNPNIHDMTIENTTGDAVFFTPIAVVDGSTTTIRSNVTIDDMVFNNVGGHDINIVGTTQDVTAPGVTLQEVITISDVTTTDGGDFSLSISNTHSGAGRTTTVSNYNYNGGATGGGFQLIDFDGTFTASTSTLRNGILAGLQIAGESDGTFTLGNNVTFDSIDGTVIEIGPNAGDDFTGTLTVNGAITNNDTGGLVSIQRTSGDASLTFNGAMTDVADAASQGIFIGNNTDGTIIFTGALTVDTTNNTAIELLNNGDTDISFNGLLNITADGAGANGFDAQNGGILTVLNTANTITTDGGIGLRIDDLEISNAGANFSEVNVTGGATNGIVLTNNTGGAITVGTVTDDPGEGGTIENTTGDAVVIENSANVAISGLRINNTVGAAVSGVRILKNTTGNQIVNLNGLEINDGDTGIEIVGGGASAGDLTMTVDDVDVNSSTDFGLFIDNVDNGSITFNNLTLDGNAADPNAVGVHIQNSDATITFDAATMVMDFDGTAFRVDGGEPAVTMNGDITNTVGESIRVQNIAGGTVAFGTASTVEDDGTGIRITGNTDGAINLLGTYNLRTTTNNAVEITGNNDNADITIGNLTIDTTSGAGFIATGGGTLTVQGLSNTIDTTALAGAAQGTVQIEGMEIGAVDFERVTSTGGTNGMRFVDNTGGTITIGDAGAAVGAGGTISNTTDTGVVITDSNVTLNGVTVTNAGGAGDNAVEVAHTNATTMNANFNRLTVNNNAAGQNGVEVDGSAGSGTFNVNFQNLDINANGDGLNVHDGVTLTAGGTNTIDTVDGVGLTLDNITVSASSANFQSVTVTSGDTNGIVMNEVETSGAGQVQIGTVGGAPNSGGSLTTVGDAIVLTNVQNVDLRDIRIVNASGAGSRGMAISHTDSATHTMDVTLDGINVVAANAEGLDLAADNDAFGFNLRITDTAITNANVVMDITGAATFAMVATNFDITTDIGGTDRAFDMQFHDGATDGDVTIRGDSRFVADDGEALFIDSFGNTAKDIKILVEDSEFTDTLGTEIAAVFQSRGNTLMQLTVQGNEFTSAGATRDFLAQSNGNAAARMRLNLGGDAGEPDDFNSALGQGTFLVDQVGTSIFSIYERDATIVTDTRNNQPVDSSGTFQNLATPPELPTIP